MIRGLRIKADIILFIAIDDHAFHQSVDDLTILIPQELSLFFRQLLSSEDVIANRIFDILSDIGDRIRDPHHATLKSGGHPIRLPAFLFDADIFLNIFFRLIFLRNEPSVMHLAIVRNDAIAHLKGEIEPFTAVRDVIHDMQRLDIVMKLPDSRILTALA